MHRLERRVRNMINPWSTAFARWWCLSARHWRLTRLVTGNKAAPRRSRPAPRRPTRSELEELSRKSSAVMAARRAAIDALLAGEPTEGEENPQR